MSVILSGLSAKNYKNLSIKQGIELNNLNIFIGSNGSGKSNFIAMLEFLKNCIIPISDESLSASPFENAVSALGGSKILDKSLKFSGTINFSYTFKNDSEFEKGFKLYIDIYAADKNSKVSIAEEYLSDALIMRHAPFFYYKYHDRKVGEGVISVWNDYHESSSHFENVYDVPTNTLGLTVLHDLLENSKNPPEKTPIYKARRRLIDYVRRWHFYKANYMNLKTIRTSEPKIGSGDIFLAPSGHNLAIVIENLIQQNIDFDESLNNAIKSILPGVRKFRPVRTGLMTVNLELYFEGISEPFYLNELSDGTVRMICWAVILLSPNLPSLLAIDEPELGIHPAWLPILAEWIKRASEKTQLIISTHSPDLLDSFTDSVSNVFAFSEDCDQAHFSITPLAEEKLIERINKGWELGDLYRTGDPLVGGWPW